MRKSLSIVLSILLLTSCKKTSTSITPNNTDTTYHNTSNIDSGLVAYYSFSGNANDSINGLNGTVHGATLTTDRFGNPNSAYYFNGSVVYVDTIANAFTVNQIDELEDSSSYIEILDNPLLHFATNNVMSISVWGKITPNARTIRSLTYNYNTQLIGISKTDSFTSNQAGFEVGIIGTQVPNYVTGSGAIFTGVTAGLITNDNNIATSTTTSSTYTGIDTNWHHFVFTVTNKSSKTYVDGVLIDSAVGVLLKDNNNSLFIGKCNPDTRQNIDYTIPQNQLMYNFISGYTGDLDDIRFYNRELTSTEVLLLYHETN